MPISLNVNGQSREVDVDPATPLLWVLREDLGLTGTKYGCGIAQCGACTVHVDGEPLRSCSAPVRSVAGTQGDDDRGRLARAPPRRCRRPGSSSTSSSAATASRARSCRRPRLLEKKPRPTDQRHRPARWPATSAAAPPTTASAPRSMPRPSNSPEADAMHALMMYAHDPELQATPGPHASASATREPPRAQPSARAAGHGRCRPGPRLRLARTGAVVGAGAEGAGTGPLAPNPFVRIGTDNLVTVVCKHHEMGQGNSPASTSLVAEELDADWAQMRSEAAPSDASRYNNLAFGSDAGHRRLLGDRQLLSAVPRRRRRCPGHARRRRRRRLEGAGGEVTVVQGRARAIASGKRATFGEMAEAASRQQAAGEAGAEGAPRSSPSSARTGRRRGSIRRPSATAARSTPSTSSCPAC